MSNNIIFTDGFDHYTSVLDKWDTSFVGSSNSSYNIGAPSIAAGAGRGGAGALSVGISSNYPQWVYSYVQKNVGAQSNMYVGFAFYWDPTNQIQDCAIMKFVDGNNTQVSLWITYTGVLYFTRGASTKNSSGTNGTLIGSLTTSSFTARSYHYIEVAVTISSTVGVASLKVDQTYWLNQTGVNTQGISGDTVFTAIQMGAFAEIAVSGLTTTNGYTGYIDDIYFDTLGYNGDNRLNGQLPSGNGTTQNYTNVEASWVASTVTTVATTIIDSNSNLQRCVSVTGDAKTNTSAPTWATGVGSNTVDNHVTWTCLGTVSQYKLVNEPNPDGDSSYITSNTVGDISRFTFPAISGTAIKTLIIWLFARKDDGGYRAVRGAIKSGATTADTGTDIPLGGNYQYLFAQQATDPNTGVAWTASGVNAAEIGIKTTA